MYIYQSWSRLFTLQNRTIRSFRFKKSILSINRTKTVEFKKREKAQKSMHKRK